MPPRLHHLPTDLPRSNEELRRRWLSLERLMMTKRVVKSSGRIFVDLGFPAHESSVMLLRAQLAEALRGWREREHLTQTQAARRLRIARPRMSEISRGKVELMSLDYLVRLCAKAKVDVGLHLVA